MNPLNGQLWAAERFAIDYVQLGPDGMIYQRRPDQAGELSLLRRRHPRGRRRAGRRRASTACPSRSRARVPTGLPLDQYGGNHIVQDIGDGNYAFYAHLKTGSVKVKPGDQLTTGQVIATLGNTGNSDAPHLHFHVMSTPDPLRSDGLPFVFKSFTPRFPAGVAWMPSTRSCTGKPAPTAAGVHAAATKPTSARWCST